MATYLYHGSMFDNKGKPLVPGIFHSKEEVFWDGKFESNRYLYACDDARNAILLGIGSMTEKELETNGFQYELDGDVAYFSFEEADLITEKELENKLKDKSIFLYTIKVRKEHGWLENNNPHNNIEGEYKTARAIPSTDYAKTEVKVIKWLKDNGWKIQTKVRATS